MRVLCLGGCHHGKYYEHDKVPLEHGVRFEIIKPERTVPIVGGQNATLDPERVNTEAYVICRHRWATTSLDKPHEDRWIAWPESFGVHRDGTSSIDVFDQLVNLARCGSTTS